MDHGTNEILTLGGKENRVYPTLQAHVLRKNGQHFVYNCCHRVQARELPYVNSWASLSGSVVAKKKCIYFPTLSPWLKPGNSAGNIGPINW